MFSRFIFSSLLLAFLTLLSTGCGSSGDVGYVSGKVKLNGEPLANATITFYPSGARGSFGRTDEKGYYYLQHLKNQDGAVIGEHRVTVSTLVIAEVNRGNNGYDGEGATQQSVTLAGRPESMPPKYLDPKKTELTATVTPGSNEIDFELSL